MTRILRILFIASFLLLSSCGYIEKSCDESNYESLSNEEGTILLYSGGVLIETHNNADIIYSDADSFAIWFKTEDGIEIYWQGEMKVILK